MNEAYIYDVVRTPRGRGKANGSLYELRAIDLLGSVLKALQQRNQLDTACVDDAVIGCVTPVDDQGGNIAKTALLYAGWDACVAGIQVNRYCASGLDAINLAAARIRSGWDDMIVAGGIESMSRVPMNSDDGPNLFDPDVLNQVGLIPQGVAADLIATMEGYDRTMLDTFALRSQSMAAKAQGESKFSRSLIPIFDNNGLPMLNHDEHPRPESTLESLGRLAPAFDQEGALGFDAIAQWKYPSVERIHHVHTAGNSSGIVDGAALALIGTKELGLKMGLKPRAIIRSVATISTEPTLMLTGIAPAVRKALAKANMSSQDIDLWEINEAFAAVVLQAQRNLNIPDDRLNVNGGAIALGHPLAATGTMLIATLLDELEARNLQTGVVSLCVGGGMGVATVIERV